MDIPVMPPVRMSDFGNTNNLLPADTYNMRVHKAEYEPTPKKKDASPYIRICYVITDGQFTSRMVFENCPISGNGDFRLHELLQVTSHPIDFVLTDPSQLLGLEFRA